MSTVIHINSNLPGLIAEYYRSSQQENIGNAFYKIEPNFKRFSNLEELVNNIVLAKANFNVIVCHGSSRGLTMNVGVIKDMSVDDAFLSEICATKDALLTKTDHSIANNFGLGEEFINELAKKCSRIAAKSSRVFIRGCNVGQNRSNVRLLANLFGAFGIDAPTLDQLYVRIAPRGQVTRQKLISDIGTPANSAKSMWSIVDGDPQGFYSVGSSKFASSEEQKRVTAFQGRMHDLGVLAFNIEHDGGMSADAVAWVTHRNTLHIYGHLYNRLWLASPLGPAANQFIVKALWDESANMMWFPFMNGYTEKHLTLHP